MNSAVLPLISGVAREQSQALRFFRRVVARLECYTVSVLAAVFGISVVIRYLRNPNPLIAARLLRSYGAVIGENTTIKGSLFIDNVLSDANATGDFSHLVIGRNCYIGDSVFFDLAGEIVIEDSAVIAGRASFITHAECNRSAYLSQKFPRQCAPVTVCRGAWVGFGATVMLGVTIGENAVVGARSLVLRDAEPQTVYVGAPARKRRSC
jgi:acetyltransferase-like isoleucine patch superfamily enzyme